MKISKIENLHTLKQVMGGNNCSCIMNGELRPPKQVNSIAECREACCNLSTYIFMRTYLCDEKVYQCFKDDEDLKAFINMQLSCLYGAS